VVCFLPLVYSKIEMFIEAKKLIGLPVAAMDTQSKVGKIRQVLIDPQNGRLLGFLVSTGELLATKKVLSVIDIKEWDPNGLVVSSIEDIIGKGEIIRIKEILKNKIFILGMKAVTESGKSLGEVEDILLDTDTESVVKYYLKDLMQSRVFPAEKVVKIEKEIIFSDDTAEVPPDAAGVVNLA